MASFQLLTLLVLALTTCQGTPQPAPAPAPSPTPSPRLSATAKAYLGAHNKARAAVGVQPLKWNATLAKATRLLVRYQRDKKGCEFADLSSIDYGGNQLQDSRSYLTPKQAVESWVAEKNYYNYANNSCQADHKCDVYTQVVWKNSLELGCAKTTCPKNYYTLAICFYYPRGNIIGEKPY